MSDVSLQLVTVIVPAFESPDIIYTLKSILGCLG